MSRRIQPALGEMEREDITGTIMVVDDDKNIGRLLKTLFELEGLNVVATATYEEVLPLFYQALPDVALMDVQVQGQETIELLHQMRRDKNVPPTPVVMTSASDRRRECLEAGAILFILKPFLPDELVQRVTDILKQNYKPKG